MARTIWQIGKIRNGYPAIVNLHTSSPNKMLLSKGIEKYGIEVSKPLCFVDFPISSFSLTDKALF